MKKPFYLIQALILCCFGTLHAQQSSRIIAQSLYSVQSGTNKFSDSADFTYSFGRGGHPDTTILYDKQTTYTSTAGNPIINNYQYTMTYDHKGRIIEYTLSAWNAQTNSWRNMTLVHYTFSATGTQLTDTFWSWDAVSSKWNITTANYYETNTAGKVTTHHMLTRNTTSQKFDTIGRYTTKYNAAGDIEEEITMSPVNGALEKYYKYNYSYNSANVRTDLITYRWNNSDNKWEEFAKNVNTVTGTRITQSAGFNWNTGTSQWDNTFRSTLTYDGSGRNTKMTSETYIKNTSTWVNSAEYVYTYNTFSQKSKMDISMWDASNKKWVYSAIRTYYYETYNPSTVSNINTQSTQLKLWPVPGNNVLNMDITWDNAQRYTAIITDMTGRVYNQWNKAVSNTTEQVDIATLPAGNYNILLRGDNGSMQTSMFTVVK